MPEPASLRVVRIVAQWLAEDPELPDEVPIDLRDASNDVPDSKKPALFVVMTNTDRLLDRESDLGMVDPLGVSLVGYIAAPTVDDGGTPLIPPPVTETRERFLQAVLNRLAYVDPTGDGLVRRLQFDRAAMGSGAESFQREFLAIRRNDAGNAPPWGTFEIPCYAKLHYVEGEF
jgi:hypothetical protein